ncbi:hypothetical protein JB92DRAFT_2937428 [Gautieria morchelliformis]|nr:hypothetical protein JB92DRAFT_2937428 [Gautieria morchelliformis]
MITSSLRRRGPLRDDVNDADPIEHDVEPTTDTPTAPCTPCHTPSRARPPPIHPGLRRRLLPRRPQRRGPHPHPLPPGGFPGVCSTPSAPPQQQKAFTSPPPPPPPFLFGSPAHHASNTDFSAAASSVLAEMNARLGLTGTAHQVSLDLLQQQTRGPANTDPAPDPPATLWTATAVTSMFDRRVRAFQKMEGVG